MFLNKSIWQAVFMIEGRRVLAEEAILRGLTIDDERTARKAEGADGVLEALVREHSRLVYRIAYAVLRNHHDAEDATQETFMRVLRYSSKLATVENSRTWLARIAWRVALDRSKKRSPAWQVALDDPARPEVEIASSDTAADETLRGAQLGATLETLISALPTNLREPMVLSAIEEMSSREVAATLGINEAAVRSRVFRARQILKDKLGQLPSGRRNTS
jgi:RNA polymerase sigma-70 factor (ECF subfamily)